MDTYLVKKKKKSASKSYYEVLQLLYLNKSAWQNCGISKTVTPSTLQQ